MSHVSASIRSTEIIRFERPAAFSSRGDDLAVEEPLEIRIEGRSIAVVMRTPGHDRELAAGFALTEGIIESARDLFDITTCVPAAAGADTNAVDVALAKPGRFDPEKLTRHVFTSSSCGICSRTSIEAVMMHRAKLRDDLRIEAELFLRLPQRLGREQATFQRTGGLHACALFDLQGTLLSLREDVGRHNALDKLIGQAVLAKETPLRSQILLLSGRASFEMMQKAYAAGIPVVAAIGAPSSLAVEFAQESGQTLIGFLREGSLNIYAGAERVARSSG